MVISNFSDAKLSFHCVAVIYELVRTSFRTGISTAARCSGLLGMSWWLSVK